MLFSFAKKNIISGFKARFVRKDDGEYLFYPEKHGPSYTCSVSEYEKYVADFQSFMKRGSRTLWLSLVVIVPLLVFLQIYFDTEFNLFTASPFFLLPLIYVYKKGIKVYQAPYELMKNRMRKESFRSQR